MERRTFIIGAVAGGIGFVEYAFVAGYMDSSSSPRGFSVKAFENLGARAALVAITPNEDFYVTPKGGTPSVKAADWKLTVDGLVSHPFTLACDKLLALPRIEKELTLECISNPVGGNYAGNTRWTRTPLKPLIECAVPLREAAHAVLYAADGFTTGHPADRIWNDENFLAYQMNGENLPRLHGYPVRIFIPAKYGMKQPKWVTRIQFVDKAYLGYWERRGWADTCERRAMLNSPTSKTALAFPARISSSPAMRWEIWRASRRPRSVLTTVNAGSLPTFFPILRPSPGFSGNMSGSIPRPDLINFACAPSTEKG